MNLRRARLLTTVLALVSACGLAAAPAHAGALSVMPVRVDVPSGRRFCSLTLGNDADRPVTVQVRGYAWSKDESGADILTSDAGFVVNPPILTIDPGRTRLVRCSLPADPAAAPAERQWRLIVDQLPDPAAAEPGVVQTLLRLSVPVFRVSDKAAPSLAASLGDQGLRLANAGERYVKVLSMTLAGKGGDPVKLDRAFYLLAGGAQLVPPHDLPLGGVSTLRVHAEEGDFDVALTAVK